MRTKFLEVTSDLAGELDDAGIDEHLNRAYQYAIPADVGGEFSEMLARVVLTAGSDTADLPDTMVGVNAEVGWIKSRVLAPPFDPVEVGVPTHTFVALKTYPDQFEAWHRSPSTLQEQPRVALLYGRQVIVDPIPDINYVIYMPGRGGDADGLTSAGIANNTHALAIVYSAAMEFLADSGDEASRAGVDREYNRYRKRLQVSAVTRPESRLWGRSF